MTRHETHIRTLAVAAFMVVSLAAHIAHAHKPSDSYLTLTVSVEKVSVRWDIALRDLNNVVDLDRDGDGAVTWGELNARRSDVADFALAKLRIGADERACSFGPSDLQVTRHSDGTYAVLLFVATCPFEPRVLDVAYELFFDVDPQHHGIVRINDAAGTRVAIFTAKDRRQRFERTEPRRGHQLASAIALGVAHIFAGIDHLLFLIALLLPAVLQRGRHGAWEPSPRLRPVLTDVLKIVTSFTLAHSITLSLSALDVIRLPSRLVESGIAASVVLAAVNNLVPILDEDRWMAAFALGLLHGFGFSATLMDLGVPRQNLVTTLFGFNVGVEIGQMCVVAAFLPLAYLARRTRWYRKGALVGGSVAIAAIASVWLAERAFSVRVF